MHITDTILGNSIWKGLFGTFWDNTEAQVQVEIKPMVVKFIWLFCFSSQYLLLGIVYAGLIWSSHGA